MDQSSQITDGLPAAQRVPRPGSLGVRAQLPWTQVDRVPVRCSLTDVWLETSHRAKDTSCSTTGPWGAHGRALTHHTTPGGSQRGGASTSWCRSAPAADPCFHCRSHPCSRTMSASSPPRLSHPTTKTVTSRKSRRSVPSLGAGKSALVLFREPPGTAQGLQCPPTVPLLPGVPLPPPLQRQNQQPLTPDQHLVEPCFLVVSVR